MARRKRRVRMVLETFDELLTGVAGVDPSTPAGSASTIWAALTRAACLAAGGDQRVADLAGQALDTYFRAADVLDDVEDGDGADALWRKIGQGPAVNLGSALLMRSFLQITDLLGVGVSGARVAAASRILASAGVRACRGQHLDLLDGASETLTMNAYYRLVSLKSGSLVAAAVSVGGILGGASTPVGRLLGSFGLHVGMALQIANDNRSLILLEQEKSDWSTGKLTLPILYALRYPDDPACGQFKVLWQNCRHDSAIQRQLLELLKNMGAFAFAEQIYQMELAMARSRLERLQRLGLKTAALEQVIAPL